MKNFALLFLLLSSNILFAQKEGNNWCFGFYAGLNFNSGSPVAFTNSIMYNLDGVASISDANGNLLFYTNGMTIWNKNNLVMTNGTGLLGNNQSTQSALIVPLPESSNIYYVFTITAYGYPDGLQYSIVDMNSNGGLGGVFAKNIPVFTPACEKITAIKHYDNKSIWIITHLFNSSTFYTYLLTSSGLSANPVISNIGEYNGGAVTAGHGYMKISPDGKTLAVATWYFAEIFDFNNITGTISNARLLLYNSNPIPSYGVEFSPDGSKLYLSGGDNGIFIYQFNIKLSNINAINNSLKKIYVASSGNSFFELQVAPDGKIYTSKCYSPYISSINSPNDTGISCNFIINSVYLAGKFCAKGLPTFMQSYFYIADFNAEFHCYGDSTLFNLTNKKQLDSVSWNFGDNASGNKNYSKLFNPKHKFSDTGIYHVVLVFYHEGIQDTTSRNIKISYNPVASFTVNDSLQCLNRNYFFFTNYSTLQSGSLSFTWNFGDSTFSYSNLSTTHSYYYSKNYKVNLVAESENGCTDTFSRHVIVKSLPVAAFIINDSIQCLKANNFIFTNNTSILIDTPITYKWFFGDGDSSILKSPVYSYKSPGNYSISLISKSKLNCSDTFSNQVIIYPNSKPSFTTNDSVQCLTGNFFTFINNTDSVPAINNYIWNFGDGKTANSLSASHHYAISDTFSAKLMTTTSNGCKDTVIKKVYVYPMPDTAFTINNSYQCLSGNSFVFSFKTPVVNCQWNFGDGNSSNLQKPLHSYLFSDTFNISLIQKNSFNCSDTSYSKVVVFPMPKADFSLNDSDQCLSNNSFVFNNTSNISSGNLSYNWSFDDSNFSILKNPVHIFTLAKTFKVKLIVKSNNGCYDSATQNIIVYPMPKADISINDSSQCLKGNSFVFANNVQSPVISRQWWFGDGKSDTGISVVHIYSDSGSYKVKMIIINLFGCKDSNLKNIIIRPSPVTNLNINDTAQCLNQNSFTLNCFTPATNYQWNLGDGNIISGKTIIYKYLKSDTFNVKLVVNNVVNCKDSAVKNIIVFPIPDASFTVNNTIQCLDGNSFVFGNSNQSSVISRQWAFGDLNSSVLQNPSHTYINTGVYNVSLIVISKDICSDTSFKSVIIKPNPATPITSSNSPLCEKETLKLTTNSNTGSSYKWTADNGFVSANQNPVISNVQFNDSGYYYVQAILNGCASDTATTHIIIYPAPYFNLGNNKTICDGDIIVLDPGSFSSYLWQDSSAKRQFSVTAPGIYSVKVSNSYGCSYEDSIEIIKKCPTRLYIPDAFSPNGDGHNDKFEIIAENIKAFNLIIFSRWGEKIFHSNNPQNSWDGTYKGSPCPVGVYYYQLYLRNNDGVEKNVNGTVMIVK